MSDQVFISFSHEHDAGYATWLAGYLAAQGLSARYDPQPLSEDWWSTYTRAQIDASSAVVVIVTPHTQQSGWVSRELDYASQQTKPIFPLLVRGEPLTSLADHRHEDVTAGNPPGPDFAARLRTAIGTAASPSSPASGHKAQVPIHGQHMALAVGIETRGGVFTPLIPRGTAVPCAVTEVFTTGSDNQESIKLKVFQGDGGVVADGRRLGSYEILLEPAPRGVPQIGITFRVDADGSFELLATDGRGRALPVTMPPPDNQ